MKLELLEELLLDYSGTVLLVSHDRAFLNNIVTSTIVFEEVANANANANSVAKEYVVKEYVGGYDDWLRQKKNESGRKTAENKNKSTKTNPKGVGTWPRRDKKKKLSYKENLEL